MIIRYSVRFGVGLAVVSALPLVLGCSGSDRGGGIDEPTSQAEEAIRNGVALHPWDGFPAAGTVASFGRAVVSLGGCTGTVIKPSWVLTANHCGIQAGATVTSIRPTSNVTRTVDLALPQPDAGRDMLMLHVDSPFTGIPDIPLYSGTTSDLTGRTVTCYGYGYKATGNACTTQAQCNAGDDCSAWGVCMTPSLDPGGIPLLNYGAMTVQANNYDIFATPQSPQGRTILPGDSGGPCQINGQLAGVNSFGGVDGGYQASVPASRDWISAPSRVMYTPGDFNGDGKTDIIITNTTGSYWYYSTGTGTWSEGYRRTDLTLGTVQYTTGDFNGDGKTDVIIVTASSSAWYYSTGTGTWNNAYTRTDLNLSSLVNYVPGDFDGDGKTDIIIQNKTGSYWYYSTGTGTWSEGYRRTDLPLDAARYVVGDFNGDGKKDVIITTAGGSYWYYSTGIGTWNTTAFFRTDLTMGTVAYTPGDFNGDGKTDVIIATAGGSYWYYSTGTGTWNTTAFFRTDLTLGNVSYTAADFNGDGKSDVIISQPNGSFWYYSTGTGTWNAAFTRTDLTRYENLYTPGDFSGDGKNDVIITNASGSYWYYSTGTGTWNAAYTRTDLPM